ncbi:MAG: glycosyltransferase [Candidatus Pedobacter colombiensis]|uniref:Glycosyltransferase n=1 Tax=Candidatus Pedobacter colombiensis TaxID=3121371 RepID=A0AAJ5WAT5_9SPHI|nr:glycosyltransferase [Pedobacter sp.]WEK21201.1 MAG: glycosyltransferase [Pedobacter sp.]
MTIKANHFENVTLLVTHYNRSKSLERLLKNFDKVNCSFYEIVVSDDGSKAEHLAFIESLKTRFKFTLITTQKNCGLGNNINKGQSIVKSPYTLYVQEDFIPLPGCEIPLRDAVNILEEDKYYDTVRFYSYLEYPNKKAYKNGFSEMIFNQLSGNLDKFPLYSDHPHLRRSNFFQKFGRYSEMKNPEKTEFDMMVSFLQKKGKGLLFDEFKSVFEQINTSSEPSTMIHERTSWRKRDNLYINFIRYIYRYILFNYSLYFKRY